MIQFISRAAHWYCEHFHKMSRICTDEVGKYQRCLDCGRRVSRVAILEESGPDLYSLHPPALVQELPPTR